MQVPLGFSAFHRVFTSFPSSCSLLVKKGVFVIHNNMFWNIWYIFINDDSMASAQLLASVYEGVQQSVLLSGADLATVTRLHWGDPRGCLYNCFADWKNKSPPTNSVNQASTVFHNDYMFATPQKNAHSLSFQPPRVSHPTHVKKECMQMCVCMYSA